MFWLSPHERALQRDLVPMLDLRTVPYGVSGDAQAGGGDGDEVEMVGPPGTLIKGSRMLSLLEELSQHGTGG